MWHEACACRRDPPVIRSPSLRARAWAPGSVEGEPAAARREAARPAERGLNDRQVWLHRLGAEAALEPLAVAEEGDHTPLARFEPVAHLADVCVEEPREEVFGHGALVQRRELDERPRVPCKQRLRGGDRASVGRVRGELAATRLTARPWQGGRTEFRVAGWRYARRRAPRAARTRRPSRRRWRRCPSSRDRRGAPPVVAQRRGSLRAGVAQR